MGCVYVASNINNGRMYIGKTTRNLEKRKREHIKSSEMGSELYFHKALRKYSLDNFEWSVLFESGDDAKLCSVEKKYIEFYGTASPNGYNLTFGGDGVIATEEVRLKKSKTIKDRYDNDLEYVQRRNAGIQRFMDEGDNRKIRAERLKAITQTEKWQEANRNAWTKERKEECGVRMKARQEIITNDPVLAEKRRQNMQEKITPESRKKAAENRKVFYSLPENKSALVDRMRKLACDPVWLEKVREVGRKRARPVVCIETGEVFTCARTAAVKVGSTRRNVNAVLNGWQKSTKGCTYRYADEDEIVVLGGEKHEEV